MNNRQSDLLPYGKLDYLCVDFDGTIVENHYPEAGPPVPGAIGTLKALHRAGVKLILWTVRSDEALQVAVDYLGKAGVPLWAINDNPTQKQWTRARKVHGDLYVDDAAFGCPTVVTKSGKRVVDWLLVAASLVEAGLLVPSEETQ